MRSDRSRRNLLQDIDPEWFQNNELRTLFERFYENQRDIREGGDPPESLFGLCESEREKLWLSRILMLPTQRFEGEIGGFEERLNEAFQLQVLKLRRQWIQRRKRELGQDLQMILADSPTGTGQLEAIHQLTRDGIAWQNSLLDHEETKPEEPK